MDNKLQKAIDLSRKTGDRLIIFDYTRSNDPFVVMSMEEYERMALGNTDVRGLTEDELLDRINRDIAVWKNEQKEGDFVLKNDYNKDDELDDYGDYGDEFEDYKESVLKEKTDDIEDIAEIPKKEKKWSIPKDRKEAAEEIIEEDRQYLEEISY